MTRGTQALDRSIDLVTALIDDGGATPLSAVAARIGISAPTAYRIAAHLVRRGLLVRLARGRYSTGPTVFALAARRGPHAVAAAAARPLLRRLAAATGRTAHLGTFDGEMVTYLVREGGAAFTREGGQLEAYCSAIGKMLLARCTGAERARYLGGGGFVALTPRTMIDADRLRAHLADVAAAGFAVDDEEVAAGLFCVAVALDGGDLAVSVAGCVPAPAERAALLAAVRAAAAALDARLGVPPRVLLKATSL